MTTRSGFTSSSRADRGPERPPQGARATRIHGDARSSSNEAADAPARDRPWETGETASKQALLNGLEAYVQDEIGARRRMLAIVDAQERAILAGKSADLELATRDVEAEITKDAERSARRARLFAAAGATWRVAPGALSLSSIAERFGPSAERLCVLRSELRNTTAELARRNRRLSVLVSAHRRLLTDLIQTLLASDDAAPLTVSGTLIDAEV